MQSPSAQLIVGTVVGSISMVIGWYTKDYIQNKRERSDNIEELNELLEGGEEWFSTGLIEIIEEHDRQIENMSQRLSKAEEQQEKLKKRVEELKKTVKARSERMEDEE